MPWTKEELEVGAAIGGALAKGLPPQKDEDSEEAEDARHDGERGLQAEPAQERS